MLCAGLYPKLLTIDTSGVGQLRTLTNNQVVYFHPSSVNFGRKLSEFGVNYLTYFTIMYVRFWLRLIALTNALLYQALKEVIRLGNGSCR